MKKFEGILICTDLDGTLLRGDKSISKENLEAIEFFKSNGGLFTFITGRMPYFVKDIYTAIDPNAPFGCINGGGVFDHRKMEYLRLKTLPQDVVEFVSYIDERVEGIGIQVNTPDKIYFSRENSAMEHFRAATGMPNLVKDHKDVDEPIAKIVFGDTREEAILKVAELLATHPETERFDYIRSEKTLYEILPKGITKGTALSDLAEICGIDMRRTVALGDYNNDIGMLKTSGVGVAVANATEETKRAADLVTVSNEENAVARVIYDIAEGKIKI